MLQNITWSQYWLVIIVAGLAYYLFVWIAYYKGSFSFFRTQSLPNNDAAYSGTDQRDVDIILSDLSDAFTNKKNKNELILALKSRIQSYQEINDPGFRDSINRFIITESLAKCSIRLEDYDLRTLWK